MFESIKRRKELKRKQDELEIQEHTLAIQNINNLLESMPKPIPVVDDLDSGNWFLTYQAGQSYKDENDFDEMLASAYKMYHTNPYAKSIVRTYVKFVFGKGPAIIPDDDNEKVKEVWNDFKRANRFNHREKEIGTRTFRDGEVIQRKFVNKEDGTLKIRFIRSQLIKNPAGNTDSNTSFGIKTNKNDIEEPEIYYKITEGTDGKEDIEIIPAKEIIHIKINTDSDQKRGISVYRVAAKRLSQYEDWLEGRIVLNKVRSAIALIKTVSGNRATVQKIKDQNKSTSLSDDRQAQKVFKKGTIITASEGIKYELLSSNINASDAKDDGKSILLAVAAAMGFPEMILTADYSGSNYASSLIAQNPFVREMEDWQDFFETFYKELFADVIQASIDFGELPEDTETTCRVIFPPMIQADLEKIAKAYEIMFKYKAVSKKTWQNKMGLDNEVEKGNIENEAGDDDDMFGLGNVPGQPGGPSPFNLPLAPTNQFGALAEEMNTAIEERDWDKIIEISESIEKDNPELFKNYDQIIDEIKDSKHKELIDSQENIISSNKNVVNSNKSVVKSNDTIKNINIDAKTNIEKTIIENKMPDINIPETNVTIGETKIENNMPDINIENKIPEQKPIENKVIIGEIKIENKIPEQKIPDININVEKTTIENKIEVPETKVEIKPEINVEASEIKIEPQINIENKIEQKKIKKKIIRDKEDRVIGIEEIDIITEHIITTDIEEVRKALAEQDWIYLIHHLHIPEKGTGIETVHHCFMFDKKNMKGNKFAQKHVRDKKLIQHVLDTKDLDNAPSVVYDHLNNGFKVKIKTIEKKKYAVLSGLVNISKTKWSDQDK